MSAASVGALFLALVAGTALIPYAFPPDRFIVGASYEVGFNNTIGLAWALGLTVLTGFALSRVTRGSFPTPSAPGQFIASRRAHLIAWAVVLAHIMVFAGIAAARGRFVFGESLYFQTRLLRMSQGEIPYVDFAYYYGPAMIYPGDWAVAVLGLGAGYAIWFIVTYALGLMLLFHVLRALLHSERVASFAFVIIAVALFNPWAGLNVTFLRFVLPVYLFIQTAATVRRRDRMSVTGLAFVICFALLYSFDVAASAVLAVVLAGVSAAVEGNRWLSNLARRSLGELPVPSNTSTGADDVWRPLRRGAVALAAAMLGALGVLLAFDPTSAALREYPTAALSYASGAYNQPIHPHLPFLTLAALSTLAVAGAIRALAQGLGGPTIAGLTILALAAHRGAFAVADPSHFAYYGLPTALVCMSLLATRTKALLIVLGLTVVGLGGSLQFYQTSQFFPSLFRSDAEPSSPLASELPVGSELTSTLVRLAIRTGTESPYLMYNVEYNSLPAYERLGLRYAARATDFSSVTTLEALDRLLSDIRSRDAIVLMARSDLEKNAPEPRIHWLANAGAIMTGAQVPGSELRALLLRNSWRVQRLFLEAIRRDWVVVAEDNGIVALRQSRR